MYYEHKINEDEQAMSLSQIQKKTLKGSQERTKVCVTIIIAAIKKLYGKVKRQPVTLEEFYTYMVLKPESIEKYIK